MNKPLVSILMPAYRSPQYIKHAIDSVVNQTYGNWELIIVDDCSGDGTWEIAKMLSMQDSRIKVHQNETNIGVVKNRAKAYTLSVGDLIGHLDNDDLLERYALEEMVRAFVQFNDVMLFYTDLAQISAEGKHQLYSESKTFDPHALHQHGWRHFGVYRRSVMNSIEGYNEKLISGCEDGDLFMQIAEKFVVVRIPKILYFYRAHPGNNSAKNKKCVSCEERMVCNYMRVWSKSANYDPITFKPLPIEVNI